MAKYKCNSIHKARKDLLLANFSGFDKKKDINSRMTEVSQFFFTVNVNFVVFDTISSHLVSTQKSKKQDTFFLVVKKGFSVLFIDVNIF